MEQAPANSIIFCVDNFKNNAIYSELHPQLVPEDRMFFNFLRYECFVAGIEATGVRLNGKPLSLYVVKMDIHQSISYLHSLGVPVDMVFIDAEKKTHPLQNLIRNVRTSYPSAVIVGDDHVFNSVKEAIRSVNPPSCVMTRPESYMILPMGCNRDDVTLHATRIAASVLEESHVARLIADMVKAGDIAALESLLFSDVKNLWRPIDKGFASPAHYFFENYMKHVHRKLTVRRPNEGQGSRDADTHKKTEWVLLVKRVMDSASSPIAYTEGFLSPFDFITHRITFQ
jgi:hypothetical protein